MNTFCHLIVCGFIVVVLSACASGPPSYEQNIQSAISGRGHVVVRHLEPGVVLLTGWVEDSYSRAAVHRAATRNDQVRQVINRIGLLPRRRR